MHVNHNTELPETNKSHRAYGPIKSILSSYPVAAYTSPIMLDSGRMPHECPMGRVLWKEKATWERRSKCRLLGEEYNGKAKP